MAMDVLDKAIEIAQLPQKKCITENVHIHGYQNKQSIDHFALYGADADGIRKLMKENVTFAAPLHASYTLLKAEVIWMVRNEMARTVEDVLARRARILFLDAKAAIELAPSVAELMANELGNNKKEIVLLSRTNPLFLRFLNWKFGEST